jgi:hypothetical protein
LKDHTIPECYGAVRPTAVFVPLLAMRDPAVFKLVTTEVFGPFQVISEFEGETRDGMGARAWPVGWMATAAAPGRDATATQHNLIVNICVRKRYMPERQCQLYSGQQHAGLHQQAALRSLASDLALSPFKAKLARCVSA